MLLDNFSSRVVGLKDLVQRIAALPPNLLVSKALRRTRKAWMRRRARNRDLAHPTYLLDLDQRDESLAAYLKLPDFHSLLEPYTRMVTDLSGHFIAHRFDLLGS